MNDAEGEFLLLFSISYIFSRCKLARIAQYFEVTVPRYHCDGYRSHFRMSSSTFELLAQMLAPSEHIPKGNAFGQRPIEARKPIALTVWALANQETCRQISDRFDVTMLSVSRCIGRVLRALVDLHTNLIHWSKGSDCRIPVHLFAYCLLLFKNETLITIHPIHMLISGRVFCNLAPEGAIIRSY